TLTRAIAKPMRSGKPSGPTIRVPLSHYCRAWHSQQRTSCSEERFGNRSEATQRVGLKASVMKPTNFERYLTEQLQDPEFATRFEQAGKAWEVALQIAALRQQAGLSQKEFAKRLKTS